jgi:type IV pilus assembly protein PilY1
MVAFTTDNAATLQPYLNDSDASGLIGYIRGLPLGAFLDGTPAFLDAPSLDPPPDSDYPGFVDQCAKRRTLIFIGGNDGMLHAIDARTGVEVWAFIPANLLPKLRALREGQPVDQFRFFVDGSPKVADVKAGGQWHTYMVFGEGPGGTFYQTMDVTMADLGDTVAPDSSDVSALLTYFSDNSRIPFKWSFPSYAHFNYTATPSANYPNTPYGDLDKDLATALEKSVGQTWSDPAVGQVKNASGSWVMLAGSGFLPYSQQHQSNRGDAAGGTTFYVIDMATGAVLDSRNVGNDGTAETLDNCAVSGNCTTQKNAVQSDPVATGPPNSRFVDTAYIGDLDGRLWRFSLGLNGSNVTTITAGPVKLFDAGNTQPLFSSMAVVNVGGTQQYVFFGSGSDLLPSTGVSQSYKLFGVLDQSGVGVQKFAMSLSAVGSGNDEKVSAYPAVAGDIVFFTTTTFKPNAPTTTLPDANVYALTFIGGPAYDNTGDNAVTSKDTPKVKTLAGAGRATAPFVADQHLVLAAGSKVEFFGDPEDFNNGVGQVGVRILSWREIR